MRLQSFLIVCVLVTWLMGAIALAQDVPSEQPGVTVHVVQRGENLFRIALRYQVTVDDIARVNGITNPSSIQVGQRLLIPSQSAPVVLPPRTHTVAIGENLESIARAYGVEVLTLIQLNGITNPNALFIGQVLTITPEIETTPQVGERGQTIIPQPPQANPRVEVRHVVQRGETLFGIAQRYGTTTAELQELNDISSPDLIFAGQELRVPTAEVISVDTGLPSALAGFEITPSEWTEGRAGRVILTTTAPATLTVAFLGQGVPVISNPAGTEHRVFIGVPLETPPDIYPLNVTVNEVGGAQASFVANINVVAGNYARQSVTLPEDKVPLIALAVEDNERILLENITRSFSSNAYFSGPVGLPAAAAMNVPFGLLRSYNGGPFDRYHVGVDFAAPAGTPVLAAAPGRVVMADRLNIRGVSVVIEHGWGIYTNYSHMDQLNVSVGDFVQSGQVLGTVGTTGRSTGAHLHWEIWVNGVPVDPMQWVALAFP